jgi:AAA domain-containing protein
MSVRCSDCGTALGELHADAGGEVLCRRCYGKRPGPRMSDAEWQEAVSTREPERTREAPAAGSASGEAEIVFRRPDQLRELAPTREEFVLEGLIAAGAITLLGGKAKAGKSTLAAAIADAVASGAGSFLGLMAAAGEVVVVTEERRQDALVKFPHARLSLLTREDVWPLPGWEALIQAMAARCREVGAVLAIIDTLASWARMPPDAEKDAGAAVATMQKQWAITRTGAALLDCHHLRKGDIGPDDDVWEYFRGASALLAECDCAIAYERVRGDGTPATHRQITSIARWRTPPVVVVDWDPATGAWRLVGQADSRSGVGSMVGRNELLAVLPSEEPGATFEDLEGLMAADKRKWGPLLNELVQAGQVQRAGRRRKGDPYRFWAAPEDSVPGFRLAGGTESAPQTMPIPSDSRREDGIESAAAGFRPPVPSHGTPPSDPPPLGAIYGHDDGDAPLATPEEEAALERARGLLDDAGDAER